MPKIPTYTATASDEPFRGPRLPTDAPLDAFGGGQARANAFGSAENVFENIQQKATQEYQKQYQDGVNQQAMEMASKVTGEETRLKTEFMNLSGPDAIKASAEVNGNLEKFYQKLEKDIQNDDVRRLVNRHYLGTQNQLGEWAQHTAGVKMRQYDQEQFESEGKTLLDSVSVDQSPGNVATAVVGRKVAIEQFAARNGLSPEWVKAQQAQQGSAITFMALNSLVSSGQDMAAKNFYEINKPDFVGHDAVNASRLVEAGSYRGLAQREVARIFAGTGIVPGGEGPAQAPTEKETYDAVDKIEDPKLQDMVRDRVRERWSDMKRVAHDAEVADTTQAANLIEGNPSLDAIPVDLYERLPLSTRKYLQTRIAQIKKGMGPQAISDKYLSYVRESAVDPDTFVKRNFSAMRDEITDAEVKELTHEQQNIIKGDERSALKKSGFLTLEKIANLRLRALGVTDDDDKEEFMNALNRDFYVWRADPKNKGAHLPPEEAKAMVAKLIGQKRFLGFLWNYGYKIQKIKDVPEADKAAIEKQLKESGETPTDDRILGIYNAGR